MADKLCSVSSALPFLPSFTSWAPTSHTLVLKGKLESLSADFNTETSLKPYEMNLEEPSAIEGKTELEVGVPELFSGLPPLTGSVIFLKSLHLPEPTSSSIN